MDSKEKAFLVALHQVNGIGSKSLWKIKEVFGSFQACYEANMRDLHASFLAKDVVDGIADLRSSDPLAVWTKSSLPALNWLPGTKRLILFC